MGVLNTSPAPTKVNGVQITQSKQGYPIPVLMGTNKIQQSLIWVNNLISSLVNVPSTNGGGKGGGKGNGQEYLYSADVIAALCNGPVSAIGSVWQGQTWLASTSIAETVGSLGSTTYTPTNAASFTVDQGVAVVTPYSGDYEDYGSPSNTNLYGSDYRPGRRG